MSLAVTVKWGKQKFEGIELDTSAPVDLFKAQLYALTQVPADRQKIMGVKGGTLKDNADLSALGIKQGQVRGTSSGPVPTRAPRAAAKKPSAVSVLPVRRC